LDSAGPSRFVLENRGRLEPVVVCAWEQEYYLRSLGAQVLIAPPPLDDSVTESFWFLGNARDSGPEFLPEYVASGRWLVAARTDFRHFAVLRLQRP
jgi:hypothetical protein